MHKQPVKAVFWDFGGVLTTSPFDAFGAYEEANGLDPGFIRRLNATNPDTNAWARFERSEVSAAEFAALFEAEAEAAGARVDAASLMASLRGDLRPAMVRAVERCRAHVKTGLLTNNFSSGDDGPNAYTPVLELFDVVVESSRVGYRKPDPHFYEMACRMLGIDAGEAVFLDDLGVNLKPARAMGMSTIKVTDPAAALEELQQLVDFPVT
ncbi:MAG: HAD-IA family hydrolase [Actinomycetota bacterium]|nr:HAD-IA family hydrolase [Actinomycetota bacterium]